MTQSPQPPEGHVMANAAAQPSSLQTRLKLLELLTQLLLLTTIGIFAFTATTALVRPTARKLFEPTSLPQIPRDHPLPDEPVDFFQHDDEDDDPSDPHSNIPPAMPRFSMEDDDGGGESDKSKIRAAVVKKAAKLRIKMSDDAIEVGEVEKGDTVYVMQQSGDWVLVLQGQGSLMGWMRRENVAMRK